MYKTKCKYRPIIKRTQIFFGFFRIYFKKYSSHYSLEKAIFAHVKNEFEG